MGSFSSSAKPPRAHPVHLREYTPENVPVCEFCKPPEHDPPRIAEWEFDIRGRGPHGGRGLGSPAGRKLYSCGIHWKNAERLLGD